MFVLLFSPLSLNIHLRLTFKQFHYHTYMFITLHATGICVNLLEHFRLHVQTRCMFFFPYILFKK